MCRCHRIWIWRTTDEVSRGSLANAVACQSKAYFCCCWHFWALIWIFEVKMIKKICVGVFGFAIGGLLLKLGAAHSLTESHVSQKLSFVIEKLRFFDLNLIFSLAHTLCKNLESFGLVLCSQFGFSQNSSIPTEIREKNSTKQKIKKMTHS